MNNTQSVVEEGLRNPDWRSWDSFVISRERGVPPSFAYAGLTWQHKQLDVKECSSHQVSKEQICDAWGTTQPFQNNKPIGYGMVQLDYVLAHVPMSPQVRTSTQDTFQVDMKRCERIWRDRRWHVLEIWCTFDGVVNSVLDILLDIWCFRVVFAGISATTFWWVTSACFVLWCVSLIYLPFWDHWDCVAITFHVKALLHML